MAIDREEVRRIAALARLEIAEAALDRTAAELSEVLEFMVALRNLDLEGFEPAAAPAGDSALRPDVAGDGRQLEPGVALAAAPGAEGGFFLVPPIVENVSL